MVNIDKLANELTGGLVHDVTVTKKELASKVNIHHLPDGVEISEAELNKLIECLKTKKSVLDGQSMLSVTGLKYKIPLHKQLRAAINENAQSYLSPQIMNADKAIQYLTKLEKEEKELRQELENPELSEKEKNDINIELSEIKGVRYGILLVYGIVKED